MSRFEVAKGVVLYKQKKSRFWWCRINDAGEKYRFSTKTEDFKVATEVAIEQKILAKRNPEESLLFKKNYRVKKILPKAVASLLSERIQKPIYKQYVDRLNNHILPYFSEKHIDKFHTSDLKEYFQGHVFPNKTSINTEKRAFRILFEYARDNKYIKQQEIPEFPRLESKESVKREYWTENEIRSLDSIWDDWINQTKNKESRERRSDLYYYFMFLINTGIRTGDEIEGISEEHIIYEKDSVYVRITSGKVQTKTNFRDVVLNEKAEEILYDRLNKAKRNECRYLFRYKDKKSYSSVRFRQLVKWANSKWKNYLPKEKTLYSCRHTYITDMLLNERLPVGVIAAQVGSSIGMIDKYYSDVKAKMKKSEFEQHVKVDKDAPFDF